MKLGKRRSGKPQLLDSGYEEDFFVGDDAI